MLNGNIPPYFGAMEHPHLSDETPALVLVHSAALHIEHKITLLQRQLWFLLLYKAYPYLETQDEFTITLSELKRYLQIQTRNNNHLKDAMRQLLTTLVEWNVFQKDKEIEWGATTLLADCMIKTSANTGVIRYAFSPAIRRRLAEPSMYAKINLLISQRFASKHALALYCLALDYLRVKDNFGTKTFSVESLRKYLGLENQEYEKIHDFTRYILKKSQQEINKSSDIQLTITPKKEGRKVVAFQLQMSVKPEFLGVYGVPVPVGAREPLPALPSLEANYELPEPVLTFCKSAEIQPGSKALRDALQKAAGIVGIETLGDYLLGILAKVKKEQATGRITRPAGFFIHHIGAEAELQAFLHGQAEQEQKKTAAEEKQRAAFEQKLQQQYKTEERKRFVAYLQQHFSDLEAQLNDLLPLCKNADFLKQILLKQYQGKLEQGIANSQISLALLDFVEELGFHMQPFDLWLHVSGMEPGSR